MKQSAPEAARTQEVLAEVTMKIRIALFICFALLSATNVWAQASATIVGAVTDSSGKVILG